MKLLCTHCGSQDHSITSCPKLKTSHSTPRLDPTITAAQQLHHDRLDLVRRYLAHPAGWPDGLDLPNWKQPHDPRVKTPGGWYTGHETYWNNLATKRRKPMPTLATKTPVANATPTPLQNPQPVAKSKEPTDFATPPLPPEKATPSRGRPKTNTPSSATLRSRRHRKKSQQK